MDLKKFLPKKEDETDQEYFWSLIIEPGWTQAGIWRISGDTAQVFQSSSSYPWELDEELVNAADSALSSAIQGFPEGQDEPSKTVFGVIPSWVSEGQIKDEYLEKIKRVCSDLSLTPIGFVVIPESISHFLKSEEGSPVNAVLVGIYKDVLEVSTFKLGNLIGTTQVTRSLSVIDDVIEGISRFAGKDAVPSRVILYNGKEGELEETKESLSSVSWEERREIQFLHTPKIEVFSPKRKVEAVCLAGASEVAGITSLAGAALSSASVVSDESPDVIPSQTDVENISEVSPSEMGFVESDMEKGGFDQNLNKEEIQPTTDIEDEEPVSESPKKKFVNPFPQFKKISNPLSSFLEDSQFAKTLLIALSVLLLLSIAGFAAWWYYPKAIVTVYISPQKLDERIEISVDPTASTSNADEKLLKGEKLSLSVNGERTRETTGIKTIGDKAKGEVTLYRVGSSLNLKSGTVITGPQRLKFVLEDDIQVASGSASTPGTTTAKVQAEAIGAEYNLPSDSSFTVATYTTSDIEAKNSESFTGGSSQQIAAVSADDQKELEEELTTELKERAKEELSATLPATAIFVDDSLTVSSTSKTFNHKVGDEATSLKLSLALNTEAVMVDRSELFALAEAAVREKIPSGFVLREDQVETSFTVKKKEGNVFKFDVLVSANLLPEIETSEIGDKIKGKYPSIAQEYLIKEVPGFARAEILLTPKLPGKLGTLPHVSSNIEVEVAAER